MAEPIEVASDAEPGRKNLRLALILATVAAMFFAGFVARILWLGR